MCVPSEGTCKERCHKSDSFSEFHLRYQCQRWKITLVNCVTSPLLRHRITIGRAIAQAINCRLPAVATPV
jgi:hypothetical protein